MKHTAWKVYANESLRHYMTTVFFQSDMTMEEVRNSLIDHDGYPNSIVLRKD